MTTDKPDEDGLMESDAFDPETTMATWSDEARRAFADALAVSEVGMMMRHARESTGRTQAAMAAALGTSQSAISDLERGVGTQGPSFAMLKRVMEACGLELTIVARPKAPERRIAPSRIDFVIES